MASIKKVSSYLEAAEQHIATLRKRDPDADVVPALTSMHSALVELVAIVRSDRV